MRRSINGPRSASTAASLAIKQTGSMGRRAVSTDENTSNSNNIKSEPVDFMEDAKPPSFARNGSGPLTDRVKRLEKKFAQVMEIQAKFQIMDKWIQQQFGIKLFPKAVVNSETFAEGNPDDVDNPFYAVYLVIQRMKTLEDKVARLEARPYEDLPEPPSNYSSAHAFRNIRGRGGNAGGGGVKRTYGAAAPSTPKKQKVMPRPVVHSSNYPFKPSVKILPRDPNAPSSIKKQPDTPSKDKNASPIKASDQSPSKQPDIKVEVEVEPMKTQDKAEKVPGTEAVKITELQKPDSEEKSADTDQKASTSQPSEGEDAKDDENADTKEIVTENESKTIAAPTTEESEVTAKEDSSEGKEKLDDIKPDIAESSTNDTSNTETENPEIIAEIKADDPNEIQTIKDEIEDMNDDEDIPILEDSTAVLDEEMEVDSEGEEEDEEVELKPEIPLEEEIAAGDVSGSEASVSSLTSASGRPRLSTRRQAAAAAAAASSKGTEDEKPVMYTARGRRHTVPRRYAEFTGHDNVVSILKSQQRAEKIEGRGPGRPGRKPGTSKAQDTPPKIKKMVKGAKTPTQKKAQLQLLDSDGDCEPGPSTSRKKSGSNVPAGDRPSCVDALVDRVMAREVDSDGMVLLSEAYPNIFVNQQQLVTVVVRSNGKATRLTRKMTTLVFEDSLLASASPFGTKYYKDRLPPEPLEAMVDFIAASGFEPHYTKKKIYMIVGQVCNEARAGRVSKKFMQPLDAAAATAGPSGSQYQEEDLTSTPPASPSIAESASPQ